MPATYEEPQPSFSLQEYDDRHEDTLSYLTDTISELTDEIMHNEAQQVSAPPPTAAPGKADRTLALARTFRTALSDMLPVFREYREHGYNEENVDQQSISELNVLLQQAEDAKPPLPPAQQAILAPARRFLAALMPLAPSPGEGPAMARTRRLAAQALSTLTDALSTMNAGADITLLNPQDIRRTLEAELAAGAGQAQAFSGENAARLDLLLRALLAEDTLTRQQLSAWLSARADTIRDDARYLRDEALTSQRLLAGLTGAAAQDLRVAYHIVSQPSPHSAAAGKLADAALSLSAPLKDLAQQLDEKAQSLLQKKAATDDEKSWYAKLQKIAQESTQDISNALKTLPDAARQAWEKTPATLREKGRGVRKTLLTEPPQLAAQAQDLLSRAFHRTSENLPGSQHATGSEAAREAVRESALLFLDEIQQAERVTAQLMPLSRTLQEAVEQHEALRGYVAPQGAASAPATGLAGALETRLAAEAARWAQVQAEATAALHNALSATAAADENALYARLSAPLQALQDDDTCTQFAAFVQQQVSTLVSLTAGMQQPVLALSARGHEGGTVLQEKAADWRRELSRLKSTLKTEVTRLTGRSLNNFSRAGMLTRGIAGWVQAQRQAFIQAMLAEGMPAERAEDLFDRTTAPLLDAGLAEFTKPDDPSGRLFLRRLDLARRHAADGTLVQPPTPEEVLAGSRTVPEDLRRWAENRLVSGAFSALLKQGISLTTGSVTLPLKTGLRLIRLTVTVTRGTRAINRGVRVGEGRPARTLNRLAGREVQKAAVRLALSVSPAAGYAVAGAVTLERLRREGAKEIAKSLGTKVPAELVLHGPEVSWLAGSALGRANLARTPGRGPAEQIPEEYFFEGEMDNRGRLTSLTEVAGAAAERRLSGEAQDTPAQEVLPGRRVRRSAVPTVAVSEPGKNELRSTALESWVKHLWKEKSFYLPSKTMNNSIIKFQETTYINLYGSYYLYHKISDTNALIENSEGENVEIQKLKRYDRKWILSDEKSIQHALMAKFIHQSHVDEDVYPELYHSLSEIMKRYNGQDAVTVITELDKKINEFIFLRGGGQKNNSMLPIFLLKLQLEKLADLNLEQQNKIIETEKRWLNTHEVNVDILSQQYDLLSNPQKIDEEVYLKNLERINQRTVLEKSKARLLDLLSDFDQKIMHQNEITSKHESILKSFLNSGRYNNRGSMFANPIEIDEEKTRLEYFLTHSNRVNEILKIERAKIENSLFLIESELNPTSSTDKTYFHAIKYGTELKENLRKKYSLYFKDNKNLNSFVLLKAVSDISLKENEILYSAYEKDENADVQIMSLRVTKNYLMDSYALQQNFKKLVSIIPAYDYQPLSNQKDINFAKVEAIKLFCDMMGIDRPDIKNIDADFESFVSKHESGRTDLHILRSSIFYKINKKNVDMSSLDYSTVNDFFTDKLRGYKNALRFTNPTLPEKYFSLDQFVPGHFYNSRSEYYQQFAEYINEGSADYDATKLANILLNNVKLTDEDLTKKMEVWKFKMDWKQDVYRVSGMSDMKQIAHKIAPVGTGTLIRLGEKHIFIYHINNNLKTQILKKNEVQDPMLRNDYTISLGLENGKFTRYNWFYKKMLGDIQPPKGANANIKFILNFSQKETTGSSSAKDIVKKAFKDNLSDITNQYKINNVHSTILYQLAEICIPLFDKLYSYFNDPTYNIELDAYDALDILTLSISFVSLGVNFTKLSRATLKGLQAAIKEDRAAGLAANVIFENSLKRVAKAAAEFQIKLGKSVANEMFNIIEPLPIRDIYKYIRRDFKDGKIGKNIAGIYNKSTYSNANVNGEFIKKAASQDAGAALQDRKIIDASGQEKITLALDESLHSMSNDFTLSDVDINVKHLLSEIRKEPNIAAMINRPAGKCEAVMGPVANFMIKEKFTDIRYRGIYIWANGLDNNPMNHFAVIGKKNGVDYVFDVTAHQFANSGMRDFEDPQILTLLSWEEKWRNATSRKLIVCSDFDNTFLAKKMYSSILPITPVDFFTDALNKNLDYSLITNPPMLNKLKSDNPGIIKTLDEKIKPSRSSIHLSDDFEGETHSSTLTDSWQSTISKGEIAGVILNSEHNNRFGIISTPGNKSDTLTLFSHGKTINEDYTIKSPEDLSLHFHTPHRTKLKNPGLGIFVHNNTVPYSVIDGKKYTISVFKDLAMTTPVPQKILREQLFDAYHQFKSHITSKDTKNQLLATGTTRPGEVSNYFYTSVFKNLDEHSFMLAVEANRLSQAKLDSLPPDISGVIQKFAKAPAAELIKGAELTDIMHILPKQAGTLEEVIKIAQERGYKKLKLIHCRTLEKDSHAKTYIANIWKDQASVNTLDNINKDIEIVMNIDLEKNNIDIFYPNFKNIGIPFLSRIELQDTATPMGEEESFPQLEDNVVGESDNIQPEVALSSPITYPVKQGDNLWNIAGKYYDNKNNRYHLIAKANKTLLSNGLKSGQILIIPDANVWDVERGDTFWNIASRIYGDGNRYTDIQDANPEIDALGLKPGQKLKLP